KWCYDIMVVREEYLDTHRRVHDDAVSGHMHRNKYRSLEAYAPRRSIETLKTFRYHESLELAAQQPPGHGSGVQLLLVHGGQGRHRVPAQLDAVETGHGEVARHVDAELVEPSEDAEGHRVVAGHHGGRTGGEHLVGDAVPVGHGGAAADRVHGQRGIGVRERVQGAEARTVGSAADGPCHVQQVVVAEPAQVLDQLG